MQCRITGIEYDLEKELELCISEGEKQAVKWSLSLEGYINIRKHKNFNKDEKHYRIFLNECSNCGCKELGTTTINRWTCPECGTMPNPQLFKHKCQECGFEENSKSPKHLWVCPECGFNKRSFHHKCNKCNFEEDNKIPINMWTCPKCGDRSNLNIHKHECNNCHYTEESNCPPNRWMCPNCGDTSQLQQFKHKCNNCNFETSDRTPNVLWVCPECGDKSQLNKYKHECPDCNYIEENSCPPNRWACPECGTMPNPQLFKHKCQECGFEESNNIPVNAWICPQCVYIDENSIIKYNFIDKDNVLYYFDRNTKQYVPWEEYKQKFKENHKDTIYIDFLNQIRELKNDYIIQSTFRQQESTDWGGVRQAFEYALVENNVEWFTYIKFYVDEGHLIKPLVVGKSGSLKVNSNGSDVSFSMDLAHGPARKFLKENSLEWCKTHILVFPCSSEKEAFELEQKIFEKYKLFYS